MKITQRKIRQTFGGLRIGDLFKVYATDTSGLPCMKIAEVLRPDGREELNSINLVRCTFHRMNPSASVIKLNNVELTYD